MNQLLTRAQAATLLGIHINSVDNYRRLGLLPTVKIRGMVRIRMEDIACLIERHLTTPQVAQQSETSADAA